MDATLVIIDQGTGVVMEIVNGFPDTYVEGDTYETADVLGSVTDAINDNHGIYRVMVG